MKTQMAVIASKCANTRPKSPIPNDIRSLELRQIAKPAFYRADNWLDISRSWQAASRGVYVLPGNGIGAMNHSTNRSHKRCRQGTETKAIMIHLPLDESYRFGSQIDLKNEPLGVNYS
jgi:hypothetical protein